VRGAVAPQFDRVTGARVRGGGVGGGECTSRE
jgi:hypothetical protein